MSINNSHGKIFYGMHFYPGVAEYQEPGKDPYRIFLNEDTLRKMDPSFAGCPIFVEHVDDVAANVDEVKKVADGWVVESFYNQADGKHWVKFIVVSERGERAIKNGMRLSNSYFPTSFAQGGVWNGVTYAKEITNGEFEHLALVKNPRYEESVIMTPEEFKKYNDDKMVELKKLSNSKIKNISPVVGPIAAFGFGKAVAKGVSTGLSALTGMGKSKVYIDFDLGNEADKKKNLGMTKKLYTKVGLMNKKENVDWKRVGKFLGPFSAADLIAGVPGMAAVGVGKGVEALFSDDKKKNEEPKKMNLFLPDPTSTASGMVKKAMHFSIPSKKENPGKVDEAKWEKAKERSQEEYGKIKWPVVTHIYKKEGGEFHKAKNSKESIEVLFSGDELARGKDRYGRN